MRKTHRNGSYNILLTYLSHFVIQTYTIIIIFIKYFSSRTYSSNDEIGKDVAQDVKEEPEPEIDQIQPMAGTSKPPSSGQDMEDQLILAHK